MNRPGPSHLDPPMARRLAFFVFSVVVIAGIAAATIFVKWRDTQIDDETVSREGARLRVNSAHWTAEPLVA